MKTYPNQKVVITKHIPHDKEHGNYGCINIEALNKASRNLAGNALAIYIRCVLNSEEFRYALSPKSLKSEMGISKSGYESAVQELIHKGYLVKNAGGKRIHII